MRCPGCGAENPGDARFCGLCQRPLVQRPAQGIEQEAWTGKPDSPHVSKGGKVLVACLAAAVVLALVGVIVLFLRPTPSGKNKVSSLFIGNSYTYMNDMPSTVLKIARSLGDDLDYAMAAPGGHTLEQHAGDSATAARIKSKRWDAIVLQEQSQLPAVTPEQLKERLIISQVRRLDSMAHNSNPSCRTVLFETWGRKNGDGEFAGRRDLVYRPQGTS